ncbi:UvrB/UvrC motif-containing protein [Alteribacillus sp. JSM 102045]|uniref:UvrB/UvrC motif-containing protein n=1 Tax=Alteribacillus sp. JSM 102045 TaxID=1562101 RepID=UPI0035C20ACA
MLCEECQQRQATLHFTKIINGKKEEIHLCDECAHDKGEHIPGSNSYSIHDLLSGLLNFEQPMGKGGPHPSRASVPKQLVCDACGLSYERFAKTGRFGCSRCYKAFDPKLDPIFKRVHSGNVRHAGKVPKRAGGKMKVQNQIEKLRKQLQHHIEQEEFEEAAKLRDQIKELNENIHDGKGDT